ncbi:hypothetical protein ABIA33_006906 [Streptacidiphilus sp. MAP12-16]|uniref:hypothetical protein n=1 Tax=Streptacidiphilus sp. MAP12-16 TaxID=3156300 RepID=UPI0035136E29
MRVAISVREGQLSSSLLRRLRSGSCRHSVSSSGTGTKVILPEQLVVARNVESALTAHNATITNAD